MAAIGQASEAVATTPALARARQRAAYVPDLLVEAHRVASTVIAGWHGRRKRGIGENFWQFRPYVEGESLSRIDWRRSARDDNTYVRDREWEAAHTVWLWADSSPSMLFKSTLAPVSKQSRAMVIMLAVAEILARSGERIASPGVMDPVSARNAAERLAAAIDLRKDKQTFPDVTQINRHSDLVLISDFLDPAEAVLEKLAPIAKRGIRGHILEICDPVEEVFPYRGRTEFVDPESGGKLTAGRAETLHEDYRRTYLARRESIAESLRRLGWNFITHHTDQPASTALVALHTHLSGVPNGGIRGVAS
ncbi:DUF58 domain-containing protein [Hoeflea sp. TYP-13]|uniref:DUF58 domain-containing protein n=1 Tax=Hoeflea sp. TYP-13 TaxID=3230023 RepID=UPI0034C60C71